MESRYYVPLHLKEHDFPDPWDEKYIINAENPTTKEDMKLFNSILWKEDVADWLLLRVGEIRVVTKPRGGES